MGLKNFIAVYSSRHYDALRSVFSESLLHRVGIRRYWYDIDGWFHWRSAQEEAVSAFPAGSRFVEVGTYLGRVFARSVKLLSAVGSVSTLSESTLAVAMVLKVRVKRITTPAR